MLKPQDIYVLLKLATASPGWTYNRLAADLGISDSEAHACVRRAKVANLYSEERHRPRLAALEEFLIHGVKYAFAVEPGAVSRGVPTGFSAPVLDKHFEIDPEEYTVWPAPDGDVRGISITPLYKSVPQACRFDEQLYKAMALVDAIRIGRARERHLAQDLLIKLIRGA